MRVVLVDDQAPLLKLLAKYLARLHYDVETFTRTDDAWAAIEHDPARCHAMLLDMTMPGLEPLELGVRLLRAAPRAVVVASSGYPAGIKELEAAGPGRVRFLQKPYSPETLAAYLRDLLEP
jgi:two-component system C4-dicarboxylate transport response regulator DctD